MSIPLRPRLGVAAFIQDEQGRILLGKRSKEGYYAGYWVFPGGGVNYREPWEFAILREIMEETSLSIEIDEASLRQPLVMEIMDREDHRVILIVKAKARTTTVQAASDLSEAKFFTKEEIALLPLTPTTQKILHYYGENNG